MSRDRRTGDKAEVVTAWQPPSVASKSPDSQRQPSFGLCFTISRFLIPHYARKCHQPTPPNPLLSLGSHCTMNRNSERSASLRALRLHAVCLAFIGDTTPFYHQASALVQEAYEAGAELNGTWGTFCILRQRAWCDCGTACMIQSLGVPFCFR